jgi:hypothetical protein
MGKKKAVEATHPFFLSGIGGSRKDADLIILDWESQIISPVYQA